jgi:hypothetical protein
MWAKGEGTPSLIESSMLESLHKFQPFVAMGQSNWLIAEKQSCTCDAPATDSYETE